MTQDAAHHDSTRRFVVLFHAHPRDGDHFDLMIEDGPILATWRVEHEPESLTAGNDLRCVRIGDHRRAYLDYEGPVSRDRGHVKQHDAGTCIAESLTGNHITLQLQGRNLAGAYVLERDPTSPDQWRLRLA